jgi:Protein of unknown function (DUF2798)
MRSIRSLPWLPNIAFGFLLSGFMSLVISGVSSLRNFGLERVIGQPSQFFAGWMTAYFSSWLVAFPVVLFVAPMVRRIVGNMFAPKP